MRFLIIALRITTAHYFLRYFHTHEHAHRPNQEGFSQVREIDKWLFSSTNEHGDLSTFIHHTIISDL